MRKLRSQEWFGQKGKDGFIHRAWLKLEGIPDDEFNGKPIIGICNTWSELTPCNYHLKELAESVKKGIIEAGGVPFEFPVMSLGETIVRPTAMLFRNLMSMDVEESIRANPIDGVVLLVGCDKTTPASVMGACSVDIPTIVVSGGPQLTGRFKGKKIGTSDVWRMSEAVRAGDMCDSEFRNSEEYMCRSVGSCAPMGTASTMATMVEALGLTLPENAAIPAADSRRKVLSQLSGRRIVDMVNEDLKPSKILTREAFENAIILNASVGGSTNFVLHLKAIANRIDIPLELDDFDALGSQIPLLANLQPSGKYLMEDFYYAGGLPAVINEISNQLHSNTLSVTGKSIIENSKDFEIYDEDVISKLATPFQEASGIVVMRGNLCEKGAIIKPSAASPELMQHTGKAVVFETIEDFHSKINDPNLEVDESCVLVLKNVGPKGYPGMPEVGNMAIPKKLLEQGVTDMVRISDGRMSGTAFGTIFLHVAPESAVGGTLAIVENGDMIEVDVPNKKLQLLVSDEEIARRLKKWNAPDLGYNRGYTKLYIDTVGQADDGVDLDFLKGKSGSIVTRDSH